jgi:hypothetical protein
MTEPRENEPSPDPGPAPRWSPELVELARRLERERPVPRAGFRATLRKTLLDAEGARALSRARVRLQLAAYAGSGVVLLAIAALGVSGVGPLAAG